MPQSSSNVSRALAAIILVVPAIARAGGVQGGDASLETIVVEGSRTSQIGVADSATQGTITGKQLETRPISRTAEVLEAVPGVIVTQHSGDGKANQYFLRGFNLDHGTDFRTSVLGMPVNMPTHAHGQGYSDLNFLIPELIRTIKYKKGTYYAEEGDFSAAGAAEIDYVRSLPAGMALVEAGQHRYMRTLLANSVEAGPGTLLFGLETVRNDGPWDLPENFRKLNGVLSYSIKDGRDDLRLAAMAMQSSWTATDQIPQRAIDAGQLSRYGYIDPSDGGATRRASLSGDWSRRMDDGVLRVNAYAIRSALDLYSNFTYFLDRPAEGDQFSQSERRTVFGLDASRSWTHQLFGRESDTVVGVQSRSDRLDPVGLYTSVARARSGVTREDRIRETSASLYLSNAIRWTEQFRTVAGLRADHYQFDVTSSNAANSGKVNDRIVSPKVSAVFTPGKDIELYANWGRGFHSNDARGITQNVDPATGARVDADGNAISPATPLVKAIGREAGIRISGLVPGLQTSVSLWELKLASELLFVGDAGTTEASRPSRRTGIEIANYYVPAPGWIIDADLAWSRPRFTDDDPAGPFIPGAIERTMSVGISRQKGPWSAGLRMRYFGSRPLNESNGVRAGSSTLSSIKLGYAVTSKLKLGAEVLNLFDSKVSDIDYYYASRLRSEAAAIEDIHTHPAEPRNIRISLSYAF
ncbi:TonB-dependent receptor [Noviherbaspirillum galbum]|uniref:TonB-dependent receptor n=1 Tax=Noviherbaspirillum galbum TaxID=2709383 RepID=A0A6B3SSY2_9BURK|nr:TonB-dependent receptor [Noviherbaspirillum galbum]NEX64080.1 TonB-dependent receptor [Noviherbaspirillum galbum]